MWCITSLILHEIHLFYNMHNWLQCWDLYSNCFPSFFYFLHKKYAFDKHITYVTIPKRSRQVVPPLICMPWLLFFLRNGWEGMQRQNCEMLERGFRLYLACWVSKGIITVEVLGLVLGHFLLLNHPAFKENKSHHVSIY